MALGRSAANAFRATRCTTGEESLTRDEFAARVQRLLWGTVGALQELEDLLDFLCSTLAESTDHMLEYRVPYLS